MPKMQAGNLKDFTTGTDLTTGGNYSPTGLPSNTDDVRLTSSSTALRITAANRALESLSVANGLSYTIGNYTTGLVSSNLNPGNSAGFTNAFSTGANDLIYLTSNSNLSILGPNQSSGTGVLNLQLVSSGNFNVGTGSALNISAVISGTALGITKTGGGTATFSGANTYTGATNVNGGTLLINGTQTAATGAVTVGAGTLGGSGTLGGAVTVNNGGTLAPGGSSPGQITASSLTLAAGSTFAAQLGGTTVGTGYDQARTSTITTGVAITIAGNLNLTLVNGFTPTLGQTFYILDNISDTALVSGTFANATLAATITDNQGNVYAINYAANSGDGLVANDVSLTALTVVPEPGTWAMVAGGAGLLVFLQQHRRKLRQRAA